MGLFVLSVLLAILGKSIFGYSLVTPFVLAVSFRSSPQRSFLFAFVSGLVVSFVYGTPVGRESLALLFASGLIHLYGGRFSSRHWAFTLIFAGLGSLLYSLLRGRTLRLEIMAVDIVLVGIALPLIRWWQERTPQDSARLKVS